MSDFFSIEISDPEFETDNLRFVTVKSRALKNRADMTLFVPPELEDPAVSVVILLHGVYGSHWAWAFKGNVHRIALKLIETGRIRPIVLAMPSDGLWKDGSGYLPHLKRNYESWIVRDVFEATKQTVEQVDSDSKLFIAGLSMGGYGAVRLAAKYPETFAGCAGLSTITDFEQLILFAEENDLEFPVLKNETSILAFMIENRDKLPPLRFDCGQQDPLIQANRKFHQTLTDHGIEHIYEEFEGDHDWSYWKKHIDKTLIFFNELNEEMVNY